MNYTNEEYKEIFSDLEFPIEPLNQQYKALLWSVDKSRVLFYCGVGTGKTLSGLFTHYLWGTKKIMVVCPSSVVRSWKEEIETNTDLSYVVVKHYDKMKRRKLMEKKADVYIINYEGLQALYAKKGRDSKGKVPSKTLLKDFDCDGLILDEIHVLGDKDSLQSAICKSLSIRAKTVIGLTGTIYNLQHMWNIFYVLNQGKTLGRNFYMYRNKYFNKYGFEWKLRKNGDKKILEAISEDTLRIKRSDCLDLPELTYMPLMLQKTNEQLQAERALILGQEIQGFHVGEDYEPTMKQRQLAGGFIYNDKKEVLRIKNNKINEVKRIITDWDDKILIFHQFIEEGVIIEDVCRELGVGFVTMRSDTEDKDESYRAFTNDDNCRICIAHPKSAGVGLNFQHACSAILYYSSNGSQLTRDQTLGRIHRKGQTKGCIVWELILEDSADERAEISRINQTNFKEEMDKYLTQLQEKYK